MVDDLVISSGRILLEETIEAHMFESRQDALKEAWPLRAMDIFSICRCQQRLRSY